jgi:hypothetical protein
MARGLLGGEDALKNSSNATAKRPLDEVDDVDSDDGEPSFDWNCLGPSSHQHFL